MAEKKKPKNWRSGAAETMDRQTIQAAADSGQEQPDSTNNIFDTVFRTIIEYLPRLVIPLINEIFGTSYPPDAEMTVLKNEHVRRSGEIITDLLFEMDDILYHMELQSTPDGRMTIRIMEYAAAIAIQNAEELADGSYHMKFPNSCVIYLRSTKNTSEKLTMHVEFPSGECTSFDIPLLKVQAYGKEQLFQKHLLMLLPYYLMRYEKELKAIDKLQDPAEADKRMEVFLVEYSDLCSRLSMVCEKDGDYYLYTTLAEQIKMIAEYLAPQKEKKKVKDMGGKVIKPIAQIMLEQGIAQGIEQGIEQGEMKAKRETALHLARRGFGTDEIADIITVNADTVQQWLKEAVLTKQ